MTPINALLQEFRRTADAHGRMQKFPLLPKLGIPALQESESNDPMSKRIDDAMANFIHSTTQLTLSTTRNSFALALSSISNVLAKCTDITAEERGRVRLEVEEVRREFEQNEEITKACDCVLQAHPA